MEEKLEPVVYRGPAKEKPFNRGMRIVVFERDIPQEHDPDFVKELLGLNPDGHTLEQAAIYGTHIFERPGAATTRSRVAVAEEVSV